jgi:hypothetical protein
MPADGSFAAQRGYPEASDTLTHGTGLAAHDNGIPKHMIVQSSPVLSPPHPLSPLTPTVP